MGYFLLVSVLLPMSFSLSVSPVQFPQSSPDWQLWELVYLGQWSSRFNTLFGLFEHTQGRCYLGCLSDSPHFQPKECRIALFDGLWEDNDLYILRFLNVTFDSETSVLQISSLAELYFDSETPVLLTKVNGEIRYTQGAAIEASGLLKCDQMNNRVTLSLKEYAMDQRKSPKVTYSFIVTLLSVAQLFAFTTLAKDCVLAERVALSVSKTFLMMNCVIDCCLWLWHMGMAFTFTFCFDYLLITALWSLFVYLMVQRRLLPIVWTVQNRDRIQFGGEQFSAELNWYLNRCLLQVFLAVVAIFVFQSFYLVFITLLHLFFLPQIISNALTREINRLTKKCYLSLGVSRLLLLMYLFGCPKNFRVWEPKDWYWGLMVLVLGGQMAVLYLQTSKRNSWLFVKSGCPTHDYFALPPNVPQDMRDCVICMTPLVMPDDTQSRDIPNTSPPMRPPCGHLFHSDCLRNWMRIKLECPTCRSALPVLDDIEDED